MLPHERQTAPGGGVHQPQLNHLPVRHVLSHELGQPSVPGMAIPLAQRDVGPSLNANRPPWGRSSPVQPMLRLLGKEVEKKVPLLARTFFTYSGRGEIPSDVKEANKEEAVRSGRFTVQEVKNLNTVNLANTHEKSWASGRDEATKANFAMKTSQGIKGFEYYHRSAQEALAKNEMRLREMIESPLYSNDEKEHASQKAIEDAYKMVNLRNIVGFHLHEMVVKEKSGESISPTDIGAAQDVGMEFLVSTLNSRGNVPKLGPHQGVNLQVGKNIHVDSMVENPDKTFSFKESTRVTLRNRIEENSGRPDPLTGVALNADGTHIVDMEGNQIPISRLTPGDHKLLEGVGVKSKSIRKPANFGPHDFVPKTEFNYR